jgi:hypothetical protein
VDNLKPVASFLGKLGNPERGGLPLTEFKRRQELHRLAEIAAMKDVPEFIRKAREIYGYRAFRQRCRRQRLRAGRPGGHRGPGEHTLILYIKASMHDEEELIERPADPKPLYYREAFLDEQLDIYLEGSAASYVAMIDPDDFVRWMFPRLFHSRIPRYEADRRPVWLYGQHRGAVQGARRAGLMKLIEKILAPGNEERPCHW